MDDCDISAELSYHIFIGTLHIHRCKYLFVIKYILFLTIYSVVIIVIACRYRTNHIRNDMLHHRSYREQFIYSNAYPLSKMQDCYCVSSSLSKMNLSIRSSFGSRYCRRNLCDTWIRTSFAFTTIWLMNIIMVSPCFSTRSILLLSYHLISHAKDILSCFESITESCIFCQFINWNKHCRAKSLIHV